MGHLLHCMTRCLRVRLAFVLFIIDSSVIKKLRSSCHAFAPLTFHPKFSKHITRPTLGKIATFEKGPQFKAKMLPKWGNGAPAAAENNFWLWGTWGKRATRLSCQFDGNCIEIGLLICLVQKKAVHLFDRNWGWITNHLFPMDWLISRRITLASSLSFLFLAVGCGCLR